MQSNAPAARLPGYSANNFSRRRPVHRLSNHHFQRAYRYALSLSGDRMNRIGEIGLAVMGVSLLAVGLLVVTGIDKTLEAWLLDNAPAWLPALTTQF